ncbi:hypothetical protein bAD24_p01145 (plasmid) [Burkholderia sp. AD24]|nr:hypothetical protein bAD24_p01145 [Burkholderia sp. AD24]
MLVLLSMKRSAVGDLSTHGPCVRCAGWPRYSRVRHLPRSLPVNGFFDRGGSRPYCMKLRALRDGMPLPVTAMFRLWLYVARTLGDNFASYMPFLKSRECIRRRIEWASFSDNHANPVPHRSVPRSRIAVCHRAGLYSEPLARRGGPPRSATAR